MRICPKCGTQYEANFCPNCGAPANRVQQPVQRGGCPRCGSQNIQVVADINGKTKGFGVGKGCLGYLCLGPFGWLCGLCGMGKGKTETNVYRVCCNCGHRFK